MAMLLKKVLSTVKFVSRRNQSSLTCEEIFRNYYSAKITPEYQIKIGTQTINYITSGHGPNHVLLLPGGMATTQHSFHSQISGFDEKNFTLVGWDAPGYYKSTPPGPDYSGNFLEREADLAYEFMKFLGINYYSVMGYCGGSIRSMILAAKHPEVVHKLVLCSAKAYATEKSNNATKILRDKIYCFLFNVMVKDFKSPDMFSKSLRELYNKSVQYYKKNNNDICSKFLKDINSPTLILHGGNDGYTSQEQLNMLLKEIKNSRAHIYKDGWHTFQMEYPEDVNKRIQEFLLSDCN